MSVAVCDTTVLYAAGNRNTQRHDRGLAIIAAADQGDLPTLKLPDPVLIETMNGLTRDVGHDRALDFLERLQAGSQFVLQREPQSMWDRSLALFGDVERLSLADAMIVEGMRHHGVEYLYSFDDDFDGFGGITRLNTAADPFG